jgi:hypothetical protein
MAGKFGVIMTVPPIRQSPLHIDNPTLTLFDITKCCGALEVSFEPILLKNSMLLPQKLAR